MTKALRDYTEEAEESISSGTDSTEGSESSETESSETEDVQWVCDNDPELKLNTSKITTMLVRDNQHNSFRKIRCGYGCV